MNKHLLGLSCAFGFIFIDALQFIYLGSLFQNVNLFLFGFLVFGLLSLSFCTFTALFYPDQMRAALAKPKHLIFVNIGALITFSAFLVSVQLIEPAITYTISAGCMPITAFVLYRLGYREGGDLRNTIESVGLGVLILGIVVLTYATIAGHSGFVRGSTFYAVVGIICAALDGVFFTLIIVSSHRLNSAGVGPAAVLGLRTPLYVVVTGVIAGATVSAADLPPFWDMVIFTTLGFLLVVPPLYLLQLAVPLLSTLTLSTLTALGPLLIFCLQLIEGRVHYAPLTLLGLAVYFIGAVLSAYGAVKPQRL